MLHIIYATCVPRITEYCSAHNPNRSIRLGVQLMSSTSHLLINSLVV